ncbi:hypothetical protein VPH35_068401 [Triticum aestivum]
MEELAGDRPGPPPLYLPLPPDDLLLEILLRLPPEPIYLFRASFVSKHWRSLVHDARFLRRFREFHGGTPPVLGFFNNQLEHPLFVPTSGGFALSTATMSHDDWWALDCRHGRALLERLGSGKLLVWDLLTGDERHLPAPPACDGMYNGTVLCAAGHTVHGDCRSCPFLVVYVFSRSSSAICACVLSSDTGVWSEVTSIDVQSLVVDPTPSALVGNTLYWLLEYNNIFEYDLDNHRLGLTAKLPGDTLCSYRGQVVIMPTEDGRLGLAGVEGPNLHLWSLLTGIDGLVTWTHQRVIDLENLLHRKWWHYVSMELRRLVLLKMLGLSSFMCTLVSI